MIQYCIGKISLAKYSYSIVEPPSALSSSLSQCVHVSLEGRRKTFFFDDYAPFFWRGAGRAGKDNANVTIDQLAVKKSLASGVCSLRMMCQQE